ncbi:Serine/threonine-protein kinase-like protein [Platanthera guangdongensis]|uniref:Serine/threonine-protein kinase-like protein n=1 Tax=Platanthera guangdongensis TaxID=2320717 RepID=A0ABR2MH36_9ASPA
MAYLSCRSESSIGTCRSVSTSSAQSHRSLSKGARNPGPGGAKCDKDGGGGETVGGASSPSRLLCRQFSYRELESATQNFSDAALLGRGSHGTVYKAVLRTGRSVAVKRPSRRPIPAMALEVENEIEILSHIQNPRLVNLIGYTPPGGKKERLLVVEFMPNGTLYDLLHSSQRPPGWARRLRFAFHTAKALHVLHSAQPPIIHRDVKSANVLLDDRFNARLGDFGLAFQCHGDESGSGELRSVRSTPPAGTLGYLDPGYITPENLSIKTDVFSFGILLLEIISGRKAIDVSYSPPTVVEWAVPLLKKGKISAIFDPRIVPPRDPLVRRQLGFLAASCVRSCRDRRPAMGEVVAQLKVLSRTLSSRVWTMSNPCSIIDTESALVKLGLNSPKVGEDVSEILTNSSSPSTNALPPLRIVRPPGNSNTADRKIPSSTDAVAIGVNRNKVVGRSKTLHISRPAHEDEDDNGLLKLRRN